jgi:hypothetical protein
VVTGTVTDINPRTIALTGEETRLIRGESTALCTIHTRARYEATLVQKKICDTVLTGDVLELPTIEAESIRFWAQDSRGYTIQEIVEIPMIPYFQPVLRFQAARKDAVSGDGELTVKGSFYNGSFGAQKNSLRLRWRLNDGDWQELKPTLEGNLFSAFAVVSGMDYTRSHRIILEATDALHSVTVLGEIHPGIPVFDWGKEDFAFHVPVLLDQPLGVAYGGTGASVPAEIWNNLGMTIPMEPGREYETWQRWQGKAVYTALVEIENLSDGENFCYHLLPIGGVIAVMGSLSDGRSLPWGGSHRERADVYCDREKVYLDANGDFSGLSAAVQIYYFKED